MRSLTRRLFNLERKTQHSRLAGRFFAVLWAAYSAAAANAGNPSSDRIGTRLCGNQFPSYFAHRKQYCLNFDFILY